MGVRWIDLVDPDADQLHEAAPALRADTVERVIAPAGDGRESRPSLELLDGALVGTLLFPLHLDTDNRFGYLEVGVVATADLLVTVRKSGPGGRILPREQLQPSDTAAAGAGCGWLVHGLVDDLAESYLDLVDALYLEIDELEDHIDELPGATTRHRLADLRHEMLHARKNVTATRAAVRRVVDGRLDLGEHQLFPRAVELAFADTYDTLVRATEELDVARDLLASVRDYLQSKITESQNEVVKRLTVVASLVLVPTLITGFYGQNFAGEFGDRLWSIWWSLGLIAGTTVLQLAFFRWKRWI